MKLTTARLKTLIREEIEKMDEAAFMQQRTGSSTEDKANEIGQKLIKAMIDSGRADETKANRELEGLKERVQEMGADHRGTKIQYDHMKVYYSLDGKLLRDYIRYI